jgi:hypothetical protein
MRFNMITQAELKEWMHYDPITGIFVWRAWSGKGFVGSQAGKIRGDGYVYIGLENKRYLAHRLAWLYMFGSMPKQQIDHKNGVRTDNCIANLREATPSQNQHNKAVYKNNTSGVRGVTRIKTSGKWHAQIQVKGRPRIHIGNYETVELASEAYEKARTELHGEFARQ